MDGKRVSIGIDLGTTYSCLGYWRDNGVEIIPNDIGKRITPSFVAFTDEGPLVGEDAYNQVTFNIRNTIFDIKRLIGRRFSEETVQNDIKLWPFKVIAGRDDKPMISVTTENGERREYTPEEISSMVLGKLKKLAEDYIGSEVEDAVITVPAYFDHCQRQATIDAGKIAGLNVLRLINEPTAAAIAYGLDHNSSSFTGERNVLVFDLGGGKLDVSFLIVTNDNIEVKAVGGDPHLGGEDFDNRSVQHFVEIFKRKYKHDISGNPRALRRLRTACERAKRSLSIAKEAVFNIDELYAGIDFVEKFTRSEFEELNSDLFDKCIESVKKCLIDAKMNKNDVDDVILAGGSSRIPKIQQSLTEFLNGKRLSKSINLDEVVAHGAAIQAAILSGQGIEKFRNLVLMDVTPLSLGIEIRGRVVYVIIPKNTAIPTKVVREFTTASDNQTSIAIRVFEGERVMSRDNRLLGEMMLTGIKPAPRRVPTVEVCFNLQADGILDVSAKDKGTGLEISTTIKDSMKLSGKDIQRMIKEANEHKANDEMYRRRGEARYAFETYICNLRNELNVKSGRMKAKIAVEEAFKWLDSRDQLAEVSEYEEKKKYLMSVMKA